MKLPPKASRGSGHPRVCTTRSRGRRVRQSSFTPRAYIWGLGEPMPSRSSQAWVSGPRVPSASTVIRGRDIHGRLVSRAGRALPVEAGWRSAHTRDARSLNEKRVDGKPRKDVHAQFLRAFAHPPHHLADRAHEVAVIPHGGRCRQPERARARQQVNRLTRHRAREGEVAVRELGEEFPEGARVDHGAGQAVLAQLPGLLEHADLEFAQIAPRLAGPPAPASRAVSRRRARPGLRPRTPRRGGSLRRPEVPPR